MIANPPEPAYPAPHYFIIYVLVAAIICGFLNPLSLTLSVAALVCMTMVSHRWLHALSLPAVNCRPVIARPSGSTLRLPSWVQQPSSSPT